MQSAFRVTYLAGNSITIPETEGGREKKIAPASSGVRGGRGGVGVGGGGGRVGL